MKLTDKETEIGDLSITIKGKQEENEVKTFFPECSYKVGRNGKEIVLFLIFFLLILVLFLLNHPSTFSLFYFLSKRDR